MSRLEHIVESKRMGASSSGCDICVFGTASPSVVESRKMNPIRPTKLNMTARTAFAGLITAMPVLPYGVGWGPDTIMPSQPNIVINADLQPEQVQGQVSVAHQLLAIRNRIERVVFTHTALVSEISYNLAGNPDMVSILVSIDGREVIVKRPCQSFPFVVSEGEALMVDGVVRSGVKKLKFRKTSPISLNDEQIALIEDILLHISPA